MLVCASTLPHVASNYTNVYQCLSFVGTECTLGNVFLLCFLNDLQINSSMYQTQIFNWRLKLRGMYWCIK